MKFGHLFENFANMPFSILEKRTHDALAAHGFRKTGYSDFHDINVNDIDHIKRRYDYNGHVDRIPGVHSKLHSIGWEELHIGDNGVNKFFTHPSSKQHLLMIGNGASFDTLRRK